MAATDQRNVVGRSSRLEHRIAWLAGRSAHRANATADRIVDVTERWATERISAQRGRQACRATGRALAARLEQLGDAVIRAGEIVLRERHRGR